MRLLYMYIYSYSYSLEDDLFSKLMVENHNLIVYLILEVPCALSKSVQWEAYTIGIVSLFLHFIDKSKDITFLLFC